MDFNLNAVSFIAEKNFSRLDIKKTYDIMILGGGPAGLTAAVYCIRKGMSTGIIVNEVGGQVAWTSGIENYMGYRHINGVELVQKFKEQVLQFGIDYEEGRRIESVSSGPMKGVVLDDGRSFSSRALIIATGKDMRRLGVPGERELTGKGVAFCSICDAPFFSGKRVVVVGGGNSAMEAVHDLAPIASRVIIVQFLESLTADRVLIDKLESYGNVEVLYEHEVAEIRGGSSVESVEVRDRKTGKTSSISAGGVFIQIGLVPNSGFVKGVVSMNGSGEIIIDCSCNTSEAGIFAAGDVTTVPFKQIIIAGGEGAKAALSACEYVMRLT
ncbi:MAG: FAD-dependent oxidoreductase [Spirochaetes bacterium]|jgi:alkyl hydroperoxide reductase subunit F|nr:FAD-dependent oxidoreductase [Spirochaetota bacterium]